MNYEDESNAKVGKNRGVRDERFPTTESNELVENTATEGQANATNEDETNAKVRKNRGIGDEHHSTVNASEMSENTTIRGQAKATNEDESNACTTSQEQHTAPKVHLPFSWLVSMTQKIQFKRLGLNLLFL